MKTYFLQLNTEKNSKIKTLYENLTRCFYLIINFRTNFQKIEGISNKCLFCCVILLNTFYLGYKVIKHK